MGFLDNAKKVGIEEDEKLVEKPTKLKTQAQIYTDLEYTPEEIEIKQRLEGTPEGQTYNSILDQIYDLVIDEKKTFSEISAKLSLPLTDIEALCKILEHQKLVEIRYPLLVFSSPVVTGKPLPPDSEELSLPEDKKLLESYKICADFVFADIKIWSIPQENTPVYQMVTHKLGPATRAFLIYLIDELAKVADVKFIDITDPRKSEEQKREFFKIARDKIREILPDVTTDIAYVLSGYVTHMALGLGVLDVFLSDNWLEEIAINGSTEPLSVYHKRYGWLKSTKKFDEESEVYNLASQIGRKVGKQITSLNPIMDAQMQSGDRVAATLFPVSTEGDTLTIRRFSRNPWTVIHMIDEKNHTMSKQILSFLWMAMQYELNILVAGGTASGKTSVLNTFSSLIPSTNRIISIEDTREISLPEALHWNWVSLTSKTPNSEGEGEVSMLDLMVASLRMRPDRIVVGEIRRKQQAEALFEAMHTGHAVSATMHADSAEQLKHRLTQPPIDIPENEIQALQLIVIQYRDRRRGVRRTLEVAELLPGTAEEKVQLNYLYRWRPRTDTFVADEASVRVIEDLNLHTGMTQSDIESDMGEKEEVLDWMLKNKLYDIDKVGQVMRIYYKYPELLLDIIRDEGSVEDALKHDAANLS